MATIRASCSDCGDVELTSADVTTIEAADVLASRVFSEGAISSDKAASTR